MANLKIALLPIDTTWSDVEENMYVVEKIIRTLPTDTDLVVLPELFSTGFITDNATVSRFAEPIKGSTVLNRLIEIAALKNLAIAGTLLVRIEENKVSNRAFLIEPSGEITVYDKHHLFSLSAESLTLTAGTDPVPVVRFRGWNIALAVCYDLRFPAWLRNSGGKYDLLVLPSNWPVKRERAWNILLAARAIENIAYVAGANRSGSDDYGDYDGMSKVMDYTGKEISERRDDGIVIANLDMTRLKKFRESFPFLNDADDFRFN